MSHKWTKSQESNTKQKLNQLKDSSGFQALTLSDTKTTYHVSFLITLGSPK